MKEDGSSAKQEADKGLSPCIAIRSELSKFEAFKASSNYLREPLASELKNQSDHFTNDAVQLLKFHGSYQQDNRENRQKGKDKDWQMMLRLRSPGGRISPELFLALNSLSEKLGNQTLRVTTRQAFQMHGIRKEHLHEVINKIIGSMGSTLAACGDISRNVMAPAAPYEKGAYPVARKLANEIADLLSPIAAEDAYLELWANGDLSYKIKPNKRVKDARIRQQKAGVFSGNKEEPLYGETYMPRKFKCAVTVPGDNSVDLLTQDIGLVVFTDKNNSLKGCNVYVGGGMGRTHNNEQTFARTADALGYVSVENILDLVQAILALQRDYGDRKTRRHARMKYLINDQGIDWFKSTLKEKYFNKPIQKLRHEPRRKLEDYLGWHKQGSKKWFIGIPLISGRLKRDIKNGLALIISKYQLEIRLTPNQDLLLCNIGAHQRSSVNKELTSLGIRNYKDLTKTERHAIACPALPLCGLAITEAERFLPELINRLDTLMGKLNINNSILFRMTGCPNGCARPYMAELALVGSGVNQYQLWLGGTPNLSRLAKPYIQRLELDKFEEIIEPLLISWKERSNSLSLGEHINLLGDQEVLRLLGEGDEAP